MGCPPLNSSSKSLRLQGYDLGSQVFVVAARSKLLSIELTFEERADTLRLLRVQVRTSEALPLIWLLDRWTGFETLGSSGSPGGLRGAVVSATRSISTSDPIKDEGAKRP